MTENRKKTRLRESDRLAVAVSCCSARIPGQNVGCASHTALLDA